MKNFAIIIMALLIFGCSKNSGSSSNSQISPSTQPPKDTNQPSQQQKLISFRNVGQWKVGDTLIYKSGGSCCESRFYVRKVVAETEDGFWLCGDLGYSTSTEMTTDCNPIQQYLVRKSDGVVIKEYAGMWGSGVPKSYRITDAIGQADISVPLGEYSTTYIQGRHYFDPLRSDFWGMQKWYADGLPLDGLVQQTDDAHTSENPYLTLQLVKAIRGATP